MTARQAADLLGTTVSQTVITVPAPPAARESPLPAHHSWVGAMVLLEALRLVYGFSTVSIPRFILDQRNRCGWHFSVYIHQNKYFKIVFLNYIADNCHADYKHFAVTLCRHCYDFLKSIGIFLWTSVWSADYNIPTQLCRGERQDYRLMDCRARKAKKKKKKKGKWHK